MKNLLASNAPLPPLLLLILLFQISCATLTRAEEDDEGITFQSCSDASHNYTSGSQYESNLINNLLPLLVANGSITGFLTTSLGEAPNIVYGLVQCRGDVSTQDCRTCLNTSSVETKEMCPNRAAATRHNDICLLRYANFNFFSTVDNYKEELANRENVTDPVTFNKQLGALMKNLTLKAVSEPSRFGTGSMAYNDFNNIYGLVQCTRDLSSTSCSECLQNMLNEIPICCSGKRGGLVYGRNCYVRFAVYKFFGLSLPPPPPSPRPPPPSPQHLPPSTLQMPPQSNNGMSKSSTSASSSNVAVIVGIIVLASLLLVLVALLCVYLVRRKTRRSGETTETASITGFRLEESEQYASHLSVIYKGDGEAQKKGIDVPFFSFEAILAATDDFSDSKKLGQGGFGPVYKGMFQGGQELAVKRLSSSSGQGLDEFKNEVLLIAKLQHRNLVRLLGYCIQGDEKLLLYEYLPNKSLDLFIFDRTLCLLLNWEKRFNIILGIARGILYLHQDSRLKIIHRDLKTSNILLDQEMNPKISDFGLARIFGGTQTEANTNRVVGTYGYMSPEYALDGLFSVKSDVYSFGIVLLEIISGKKNSGFYKSEDSLSLIGHTWRLWNENKGLDFIDDSLRETCNAGEVLKCIHVGLLCVQEEANDRPAMYNVILMLGSETITLPIPKQPALVLRKYQYPSIITTNPDKSDSCTKNEITISEQEGR